MARSNGNSGHGSQGLPPAPPRPQPVPSWQGAPDGYAAGHGTDPRTVPAGHYPQPGYAPDPHDPHGYAGATYGYGDPSQHQSGFAPQPPGVPPAGAYVPPPAAHGHQNGYPPAANWAAPPPAPIREPQPLNLADFNPGHGYPPQGQLAPQGHGGRLPMPPAPGAFPMAGAPDPAWGLPVHARSTAPDHQPYDTGPVQGYPPAHAGGYASIPIPAAQQPSAQGYARIDGPDEYEEDEYEEEPKRRRPSFMIIGALVGAICAGGGLAYAYKSYFSGSNSGPTPLLRADQSPTKAKAASSGSKVNERFGDTSTGSAVAAASDTDLGRPRAVATQTIAVSPPPVMNAPPPTASSGVPGLVLDGAGIGPRPLPPVVPVAPPGPTPVGRPLPPVAPAVVPQAGGGPQPIQPRVVAAAPPVAPPAAPAAAPQPVPKVAKAPPPKANDAYVPGAGAGVAAAAPPAAAGKAGLGAAPSGAAGGNGHVAVVASQKDRLAAMKAFADLQQKHPSILGSKMAEVVEVNLGEAKGGVWFRALVGPPGSREAADKICADLRAAGVPKNQCWATAY